MNIKNIVAALLLSTVMLSVTACSSSSQDNSSEQPSDESVEPPVVILDDNTSLVPDIPSSYVEPSATVPAEESPTEESVNTTDTYIGEFDYTITDNNTCKLLRLKGEGNGQTIVIPSEVNIDGKTYKTELGTGVFAGKSIYGLVIPDTITEIPDNCCTGCKNLTELTLPDTVISVGKSAFEDCTELQLYELPKSVKYIGENAFVRVENLTGSITIMKDMVVGEYAFTCCNFTDVTFENGITNIPFHLFYGNHNLTSVNIPETVTAIGEQAFDQTNISTVKIPISVKSIGKNAFVSVKNLEYDFDGVIVGYKGSTAEEYATKNNIIFSALD